MKEEERNTGTDGRKETNKNNIRKIRKTKRGGGRHRTAENKHKKEEGYEEKPKNNKMITRRRHKIQNR